MNGKILDVVENGLIVLGVSISLPQLETILGIIILSVKILLILIKGGMKIYQAIKNKQLEKAISEVEATREEITSLTDKTKHD